MRPRKALEVLSFCGAEQRTRAGMCRPAAAALSNAWRRITRVCRRNATARSRARRV